jgi:branched-chain amino acid transport system ATP-binding protein
MSAALLRVENIDVKYGGIQALCDVSFTVNKGEIVTLIGANGAGKTTCLRAISGIVPLKKGRILYESAEISHWSHACPHKVANLGISHVPEGRGIFPELTVDENLELGTWNQKNKAKAKQDLEKVFHYFPRLKERHKQLGGTLSGGEQQMLAIGRALMMEPCLLLLDEPSLGLAPQIIATIFRIIKEINETLGTTILLVEQNAHLALQIAHRGIVLETGALTLVDEAKNLLNNSKVRDAYLGQH